MIRFIKRLILVLLLLISSIGFLMSILGYFSTLVGFEKAIPQWVFSAIFGIPIVFVPAIIVAVAKTIKYKGEYLYGIRFYPAIRKAPKLMAIFIYILLGNLIATILIRYLGYGKDLLILSSGMLIFYYIPLLIFLSAVME